MELNLDKQKIAQLLSESFHVDIQIFIENSLKSFKNSEAGYGFYNWAINNRIVFEILIRLLSVFIQEQKVSDKDTISKLIYNHLGNLPREIRRTFIEDPGVQSTNEVQQIDESFQSRFESAITDLGEDDLRKIVRLNQAQRNEWVNSPQKLRKFLLEKWFPQHSNSEIEASSPLGEFKKDAESFFKKKTWLERKAEEAKNKRRK